MAESRRRVFATRDRIIVQIGLATSLAVVSIVYRHSVGPVVLAALLTGGYYLWTCSLSKSPDDRHRCRGAGCK